MQKTKFCFVFMLYAKQHNCMLDLNKAGLVYFLEVTEMMTALKKKWELSTGKGIHTKLLPLQRKCCVQLQDQ